MATDSNCGLDLDPGPALRLEEAVREVLRDTRLCSADRATLENAVRIARSLQKALRPTG